MAFLNILTHYDGTTAWENLLILLGVFVAGWILQRLLAKQKQNSQYNALVKESESKVKTAENELKAYKANTNHNEKAQLKSLTDLGGRVKALEGDIRVLSEERNKYHQLFIAKSDELKKNAFQVVDLEDHLKSLKEERAKGEAELNQKLKTTKEELVKASAWEARVKNAEEEAQKARAALGMAERKKLEAELRLKATSEFAARVVPLENDLKTALGMQESLESTVSELSAHKSGLETANRQLEETLRAEKEKAQNLRDELSAREHFIGELKDQLAASVDLSTRWKTAAAEMDLLKSNIAIMKQELAAKQTAVQTLQMELEQARSAVKIAREAPETPEGATGLASMAPPSVLHESSPDYPSSL
jgi:chromosome segregation ATPase